MDKQLAFISSSLPSIQKYRNVIFLPSMTFSDNSTILAKLPNLQIDFNLCQERTEIYWLPGMVADNFSNISIEYLADFLKGKELTLQEKIKLIAEQVDKLQRKIDQIPFRESFEEFYLKLIKARRNYARHWLMGAIISRLSPDEINQLYVAIKFEMSPQGQTGQNIAK